ncbi:MAG TPA: hypothetical protein VFG68_02135 [Fimbriiglobus sp.]|nr:hypothetical protein [Fimbriiglobus sp.]
MTCRRTLIALSTLLAATAAAADEPGSIFRFKEYAHPLPEAQGPFAVTLSPDGKSMAAAAGARAVVWSTRSGKTLAQVPVPNQNATPRLAFGADGKTLLTPGGKEKAVRVWDLTTGKQVSEAGPPAAGRGPIFAFDPRAKRIVTYERGEFEGLRAYDLPSGKAVADLDGTARPQRAAFSPDGRLLACASTPGGLLLLDTTSGKKVRELLPDNPASPRWGGFVTFSPDGQYVADGERDGPGNQGPLCNLTVWRVADGKQCARVFTGGGFTSAAFAIDGRTIAASGGPHGLYLYDLATDTLYLWAKLPSPHGVSVAASADGSTLAVVAPASIGGGRSVYVMPFPKYEDNSFGPTGPTDKQLAESWDGLVGDNEFRKAHEIARLRPHADMVVALAREKVQPVPDLYRQRAADLIDNLDSPDIRDKVTENLRLMAHDFQPLLESALTKAKGETRTRLAAVLKETKETPLSAKLTAAVRAVEVLERLDTPAATKALEELAAGAAGAKVTAEAAAALKRNADRPRGRN